METMGSGVVFFDYDADGWLDLYFVNSAGPGALYRNKGDGDLDLYITCYGPNILYRNEGDGTFTDATAAAKVAGPQMANPGMSTGAAFADHDADGDLDLFVGNYAEFRPALHKPCIRGEGIAVYCGPEAFAPQRDVFYRNDGNGTFTDIADEVGLLPAAAKELGAS